MLFISKKLNDGRYGIYVNSEIAAYISCPKTYQKLVEAIDRQSPEANKIKIIKDTNAAISFHNHKIASQY